MKDEKIIEAIRRGDETAIDHVITKYSRLLWSVAGAVLKNAASEQDVEECVADVFIYLWQHPEKYDPGRGGLRSWLSVVARTRAIDRYRELSRRDVVPLDDTVLVRQLGVMEGILAEEEKRALAAAVKALGESDREILLRRYYYDQKPREIALAMDMPVKHVENHLYRTKKRLRETISN